MSYKEESTRIWPIFVSKYNTWEVSKYACNRWQVWNFRVNTFKIAVHHRWPLITENNHLIWNANHLIGFYKKKAMAEKVKKKNVKTFKEFKKQ